MKKIIVLILAFATLTVLTGCNLGLKNNIEFELNEGAEVKIEIGADFTDPGITVTHKTEDISSYVATLGSVDTSTGGSYTITYTLDYEGITIVKTRTVIVEWDYSNFEEHLLTSYNEAETIEDERYVVYYYGKSCGHCINVKQDVLDFFSTFELLPFYILEVQDTPDSSSLDEFIGTPTMFIMADGEVVDMYVGSVDIYDFFEEYKDVESIPLDYDHFKTQELTSYTQALEIESEAYLLYYYLDDCPHCIAAKDDFLEWAFERDVRDVYFMNGATVSGSGTIPTELIILNSGTPILVVMTNGMFADEYYSGTDEVLDYIELIGMGEITTIHYEE